MEKTKEKISSPLDALDAVVTQLTYGISPSFTKGRDSTGYRFAGQEQEGGYKVNLEQNRPVTGWDALATVIVTPGTKGNQRVVYISEPTTLERDLDTRVDWKKALLTRVVDIAQASGINTVCFNPSSFEDYSAIAKQLGFTADQQRRQYTKDIIQG